MVHRACSAFFPPPRSTTLPGTGSRQRFCRPVPPVAEGVRADRQRAGVGHGPQHLFARREDQPLRLQPREAHRRRAVGEVAGQRLVRQVGDARLLRGRHRAGRELQAGVAQAVGHAAALAADGHDHGVFRVQAHVCHAAGLVGAHGRLRRSGMKFARLKVRVYAPAGRAEQKLPSAPVVVVKTMLLASGPAVSAGRAAAAGAPDSSAAAEEDAIAWPFIQHTGSDHLNAGQGASPSASPPDPTPCLGAEELR